MNKRLVLLFPLAIAIAASNLRAQQTLLRTSSHIGTNEYSCVVTDDDMKNVPKWNENNEDWPPLSARKAIEAVKSQMNGLVSVIRVDKWTLNKVALQRVGSAGNWVYVVTMNSLPAGVIYGRVQSIEVVVLLNGRVIKPIRVR